MYKKLLITFSLILSFAVADSFGADFQSEAWNVVDQYMNAIFRGDVQTAKSFMGGDLLRKRSRLLDNPDYPRYLSENFMDAQFQIKGITSKGADKVQVDVKITLHDGDEFTNRYILKQMPDHSILLIDEFPL